MGAAPLPTAATPGFGLLEGRVACACLTAWWPWFTRLGIAQGLIRECFDVLQFTGDNPKSAGVHIGGGVWDIVQTDPRIVALARRMGAWATWERLWKDNEHTHGVLAGCPHLAPGAVAQLEEVRAGGDGLLGDLPDPHPDPDVWRTWEQGIAWARAELTRIEKETDDMFDAKDRATLERLAAKLETHEAAEAGRYQVATGRYQHVVGLIKGQPDADAQALADAIPDTLAQDVVTALVARLGGAS